jgi:predicted RNA binding protein YcfA (HicA-like mRNA interferase family)
MPKIPRITGEAAVKAFKKLGYELDHITGSHHILKRNGVDGHLSIPCHKGQTVGIGLLKSQILAAGITVERFIELL